ncbi:hypothetical protein D3C81_1381470 [compost metagenome]
MIISKPKLVNISNPINDSSHLDKIFIVDGYDIQTISSSLRLSVQQVRQRHILKALLAVLRQLTVGGRLGP